MSFKKGYHSSTCTT